MTNIIIRLQEEGLHQWKDAKNISEVNYLSNLHRHIFYIECKIEVHHNNRDIEFIMFKHKIKSYLEEKYWSEQYQCLNFNEMSCEMIANELFNKFDLNYCSVFEENENGAEKTKV